MASYIGIVELIPIGTGLGCASFEASLDSPDRVMISIQLGAMYASERSGTQSFWREFQVIFSVTKSIGTSIRVRFQLPWGSGCSFDCSQTRVDRGGLELSDTPAFSSR
jgi:hypothetical protein